MNSEIEPIRYTHLNELIKQATALSGDDREVVELADAAIGFVRSGEFAHVLNDEVRRLARSHVPRLKVMDRGNFVLLNKDREVSIYVGESRADLEGPLVSSATDALLVPFTPKGVAYNVFEYNKEFDLAVFDPSVAVVESQRRHCDFGDYAIFPAGRVQEYATSGSLVLKILDARPASRLVWEFNRSSGAAVAAYGPDHESTTIRHILRFLTEFGNSSSVDAIRGLLSYPLHYVRWEAVRAIAQLQPDSLREVLENLASDAHPHIRNAANKMLEAA